MSKKRVFVSHPFAGDAEGNRVRVDKICKKLEEDGFLPISPLHAFSYKVDDSDRELVMESCFRMIDFCDAVFIYGSSKGCIRELRYARRNNKRVEIKY
jgi:nucleoside 2-deoxyribosyltransferase